MEDPRVSTRHTLTLRALERALFVPQFVAIDSDNRGAPVADLDKARAALARGEAATIGGRLADCARGADIDADDPVTGDAAAEMLVAWCVQRGLPYLVRESGRPGGRHVITVVARDDSPVEEWSRLCAQVADQLGVSIGDRTGQVLRLPTAPHRKGLPAPVLACTITPAMVMDLPTRRMSRRRSRPFQRANTGNSRSENEFGMTCAMARAGWDTERAWREIAEHRGKSAERGREWWTRHMWVSAVSIAAAEDGLDERAAWQRVRQAHPRFERRSWTPIWTRARAEAKQVRPRRRRIADVSAPVADQVQNDKIEAIRTRFAAAVRSLVGVDPRRQRSVDALLYALSPALVTREGSMSTRCLSIASKLDLGTVRRSLATAIEHGLLVRVHEYTGGSSDCAAYAVGPAVAGLSDAPEVSSLTRGTPHPPTGSACTTRLRNAYARDRRTWRLRNDVLASLAPGERLADSQHPAAKTLRSLRFQRVWWTSQTSEQQEARRTARRAVLAQLHRSQRSEWLTWLAHRGDITSAADRILTHRPRTNDAALVSTAPTLVHRGLADSIWHIPPRRIEPAASSCAQLELCSV